MNLRFSKSKLLSITTLALSAIVFSSCTSGNIESSSAPDMPEEIPLVTDYVDIPKLPPEAPDELKAIWEAYHILRQEFVDKDKIDPEILAAGALEGMLNSLDAPHTSYIPESYFDIETEDIQGSFQGIGSQVYINFGRIILSPFDDSPASQAGVKAGDIILKVNGEDTKGWTLLEAVRKIRGPSGTIVRLEVRHLGMPGTEILEINRGVIPLESVTWNMMRDGIAYAKISSFYVNTNEIFSDVIKEIQSKDAIGLILDVRNNPGGILSTAIDIASQFLEFGAESESKLGNLVLYEIDGYGRRVNYTINPNIRTTDIPMVILVNKFSASASEVLAGALQDHGRAIVIGETTFGKASINRFRGLSEGGGIYYTYALWYTPKGQLLEGSGLKPDVVVKIVADQRDIQLEQAVEHLKQKIQ